MRVRFSLAAHIKMNTTSKNFLRLTLFPFLVYVASDIICKNWNFFYTSNKLDTYFHFLGGFSIAFSSYFFLDILEGSSFLIIKRKLLKALFIISLVFLAAVLWEIYEFIWDLAFHTNFQPSNFDTMKDLIMDALGSLTFCVFGLRPESTNSARKRYTLANMLGTSNPAHDSLETNTKTRMRD